MAVNRRLKKYNQKMALLELPRLAKLANTYYYESHKHYQGLADSARKCGEMLNKARYFGLWRRPGWKKWIEDNFDGSYETAKVYMRIAKKWDDPRLLKARQQGITFNSIKSVLDFWKRLPSTPPPKTSMTEKDTLRRELRDKFSKSLHPLCVEELLFLRDHYDNYWEELYNKVYQDVCNDLEYDLNTELWKAGKIILPEEKPFPTTSSYCKIDRAVTRQARLDMEAAMPGSAQRRYKYVSMKAHVRRQADGRGVCDAGAKTDGGDGEGGKHDKKTTGVTKGPSGKSRSRAFRCGH